MKEDIEYLEADLGFRAGEPGRIFFDSLSSERRRFIELYLPPMAAINDLVDSEDYGAEYQKRIKKIITNAWEGEKKFDFKNKKEIGVDNAVRYLRELYNGGNDLAKLSFEGLLELQDAEYKNTSRRWKILDQKELYNILHPIAVADVQIILSVAIPEIGRDGIVKVSKDLGWALRIADTISDYYNDIPRGYINIPQENIEVVHGINIRDNKVVTVDNNVIIDSTYLETQYKQAKQEYEKANRTINTFSGFSIDITKRLKMAEDWAKYFLLQAQKFVYNVNK